MFVKLIAWFKPLVSLIIFDCLTFLKTGFIIKNLQFIYFLFFTIKIEDFLNTYKLIRIKNKNKCIKDTEKEYRFLYIRFFDIIILGDDMERKIIIGGIILLVAVLLCVYPSIEFKKNNKLYLFGYGTDELKTSDFKELESDIMCYDESYIYNLRRNISIKGWEFKNILFFNYFVIDYVDGFKCANEFVAEEGFIDNFLNNAKIIENNDNVDLRELIKGKKQIESNKRYPWSDDASSIYYELDGEENEMHIYTNEEGLLIIQVGNCDEGPKYLVYK